MTFETCETIDKWVKEHRKHCISRASAGEQFIYEFIPSGIVEVQTVKCMCCGEKFTYYSD